MVERIMDINAIYSYLAATIQSKKVKVRETDRVITITPVDEAVIEERLNCPFLGIAADSNLSMDKFLKWKQEERKSEYEKELRS